jgi:hypothetical protein
MRGALSDGRDSEHMLPLFDATNAEGGRPVIGSL